MSRKSLMEAKLAGERARRLANDKPTSTPEPISFAPVVVTNLGRIPVVSFRLGEIEVDVFEPDEVDPSWLAQVIDVTMRGRA